MRKIDKVFVIHVKEGFEERRAHIQSELERHGIDYEFVLNDDIADLTDERISAFFSAGHSLKYSEVSCSLKHYSVLERVELLKYSLVLVFEDDVFLAKNFNSVLDEVLSEAEKKDSGYVIYLGNAGNKYVTSEEFVPGQFLYRKEAGRATDSYLMDSVAAMRRLDYIRTYKGNLPTGHMMSLVDNAVGNTIWWTQPSIAEQGSQNGRMRSTVSRNKRFHRLRWLIRDVNKRYLSRVAFFRKLRKNILRKGE
jgi:glycosyl transferase family 25